MDFTQPTDPNDKNDAITEMVKNAKLIGLGESVRGSESYIAARIEVTKLLIQHAHVRGIILEQHDSRIEKVRQYIKSGEGEPEQAVKDLAWTWQSKSMVNFLKWVRNFNQTHDHDPVTLFGAKKNQTVAQTIANYIRHVSPRDERLVLWSNNCAIAYNQKKIDSRNPEIRKERLGTVLKRNLKNKYEAIALIANKVSTRAPREMAQKFVASSSSLENILDKYNRHLFVNLEMARANYDKKMTMSEAFFGFGTGHSDVQMNPVEQYSGLIFLRDTSPIAYIGE